MLLTLLVFIKIPLSVFPWVFLWRSRVEVFLGFGAKIKPAFCDVWSVGVLSVELSDWVLVILIGLMAKLRWVRVVHKCPHLYI